MRPVVIIAGCHRSGTSALTRAMGLLGWQLPRNPLPGNSGNNDGYWEPAAVVEINDRMLTSCRRSWLDPKPFDLNALLTPHWIDAAKKAFESEFPGDGPAVLKDPRMCRLLPVWRRALAAPNIRTHVIITRRRPLDIWQSLARRDAMDRAHAEALWASYMLEAEEGSRGLPRALLAYEDLVAAPMKSLAATLAVLGLATTHSVSSWQAVRTMLRPAADLHAAETVGDIEDAFAQPAALDHQDRFDYLRDRWRRGWEADGPLPEPSRMALARPETHAMLAISLAAAGDVEAAHAAAQRGAAIAATGRCHRPQVHQVLRQAFIAAGDTIAAIEQARLAVKLAPASAHEAHQLGLLEQAAGHQAEAETCFRRALAIEPNLTQSMRQLAFLLLKSERYRDALPVLSAASSAQPGDANLVAELALLHERLGQPVRALEALNRGISLRPDVSGLHTVLAGVHFRAGDKAAAEAGWRSALAINSDDADARASLAMLLMDLRRTAEALPHLEIAIKAFPEHGLLKQLCEKAKAASAP